jgi:Domain of unknown function (DUF6851)/VCPO second helical-bundle domain
MSNERAKVNDSDPPASSLAGSRLSRRTFLTTLASAGLLLYVAPSSLPKAASAAPANASVILSWNEALLDAIPATRMGGPIPNRALAIVHTAIYDAWTPYTEGAKPTAGAPLRRPQSERTLDNKSEATSYAAYRTLLDLFPTQKASFDELMMSLGYDPADTSTGEVSPSAIGNLAAQRVLKARRDDGSNQENGYRDTTNYQPVNTPDLLSYPNRWQPLRVGSIVQQFVAPHWGQVRPFALSSGSELRNEVAGMLKRYPTKHYVEQHSEVLRISAELDDRKKTIAEYWADGPGTPGPPGHWNVIAQYVSKRDSHDLDRDVKLYFVLNNALMDCAIAAWDVKRYYDSVRPISAIRFLYAGKQVQAWGGPFLGTRTIDGATWHPYQRATVVTPPFAEFVSGHSTVSSAAADVLKSFTGSNYYGASWTQPAGASLIEPGLTPSTPVTLSWETFTEAAEEAGMSRLFGGIHISDGNVGGLKLGQEVAKRAWNKAQTYFNGD